MNKHQLRERIKHGAIEKYTAREISKCQRKEKWGNYYYGNIFMRFIRLLLLLLGLLSYNLQFHFFFWIKILLFFNQKPDLQKALCPTFFFPSLLSTLWKVFSHIHSLMPIVKKNGAREHTKSKQHYKFRNVILTEL